MTVSPAILRDVISIVMLSAVATVAFWTAIALLRQERNVDRENQRRRQRWLDDCGRARAGKQVPPFPPNVLKLG